MYICLESVGALPEVGRGGGREARLLRQLTRDSESPLSVYTQIVAILHSTAPEKWEGGGELLPSNSTTLNLRTSHVVGPKAFFLTLLLRSDNVKEGDFSVHSCYWKRRLSLDDTAFTVLRYNTKGYCCGQRTNWSLQSVALALEQVVRFF